MLVISRRVDERIMIGNDVVVTILGISRRHVRIGISAPKNIPVHREEIHERIQAERAAAVSESNKGQ